MNNQDVINELTAELEAFIASRKAENEAYTVKDDFPPLKRTWRFQEWTGLSHIQGGKK